CDRARALAIIRPRTTAASAVPGRSGSGLEAEGNTMRSILGKSVVVIGLAFLLSGCGPAPAPAGGSADQPTRAPAASQAETPKRGGMLTFRAGPDSYGGTDPAMGQQGYNVWPIIGEYLLRSEPETWKLVGGAIEQWDYSADGLTLTLHLRKGLKFHDKP